jgi:FHA domain
MPEQLLLWIDGVGGYLVCLKPRLTIGQSGSDVVADLAIQADISRQHATLERDAEGYSLMGLRPLTVNGQALERAFLRSGDRLTMGKGCQLLFTQPVPVSGSARLDLVSGQRWRHPVQAALLMAETLVIGPGRQAHVNAEELKEPMILFRHRSGLAARYNGDPKVNGPLSVGARIVTDVLSFTLDAV